MHPMLNIAVRAARQAGQIINRYVGRIDSLNVATKSRNDFVSEVDRMAEQAIVDTIRKAYPHHGIVAEETHGEIWPEEEFVWVIDPLDGTTNYLHGFPQFAVSIAMLHQGQLDQSLIYDPLRNELFTASRGNGAQLNDRRIRVSKQRALEGALVGTGFPFKDPALIDTYLATFRAVHLEVAGIRRAGSAALDLAYVAAGRLDGFWEFGLKPWDLAAGCLLIQEAGGVVTDFGGGTDYLRSGNLLGGNLKVHAALSERIRPHLPAALRT